MLNYEPDKLQMLKEVTLRYPQLINPKLCSLKYCQTKDLAYVELIFEHDPNNVALINLDIIAECFDLQSGNMIEPLFNPRNDIVDNARLFLQLNELDLINVVDDIFKPEAYQEIVQVQR